MAAPWWRACSRVPNHTATSRPRPAPCSYWSPAARPGQEAPLYDFGHGLSYTTFAITVRSLAVAGGAAHALVDVRNAGAFPADTAVLAFMRYAGPSAAAGPGPRAVVPASGCDPRAASSELVKRLVGYQRTPLLAPAAAAPLAFKMDLGGGSRSAWAGFGDPAPPCGTYVLRFGAEQREAATLVLLPRAG